MNPITERLDKIASALENKGYIKEATEIDLISNTIEKLSYQLQADPLYKALSLSLQALKRGNTDTAFGFLDNIAVGMQNRMQQYGDIDTVKSAVAMYQAARKALKNKSASPEDIKRMILDSQEFFQKAEGAINQKQLQVPYPIPQGQNPGELIFTSVGKKQRY